jgi:hypothetical protein
MGQNGRKLIETAQISEKSPILIRKLSKTMAKWSENDIKTVKK